MKPGRVLIGLAAASVVLLALALAVGSVPLSLPEVLSALAGQGDPLQQSLVWELRLPRAASAFIIGAQLALAGALMQVLLRNPLADPYILGVSGGAGVAALCAMLLGLAGLLLTASAFVGALLSTLLVFGLAHSRIDWTPTRLLLTGVVVAMGWGALISFILAIAPEAQLRGMLFWLMGDLSYSQFPALGTVILLLTSALIWPQARDLNVLARGEWQAAALGVEIQRLRWRLYFIAALLTASAVVQAGSIGFIGLVVPHLLRLLGCHDHRYLLPAAVLCGGSLLLLGDTLARSMIAPQQLPVGIITAFIGVPLFLYLLNRRVQ
ncbi:MAG: iron ABC transporter permease [Pseudomonadota bacterium]